MAPEYVQHLHLPPELSNPLKGASVETIKKMNPLLENSLRVYDFAVKALKKEGLTPWTAAAFGVIDNLLPHAEDQNRAIKREIAAEFRHTVTHVIETTLGIKRFMIEHNMPERVIAYQTGTGFPLPQEIEGKVKRIKDGYLPFGKGLLKHIPKPRIEGHGEEENPENAPGLHFYEVTGENGEKMTMIAIKGRFHGYEAKTWQKAYPHHVMATLPRILKGLGVESVLTTFASGFDAIPVDNEEIPKVGDFGYVIASTDMSRETEFTHPGIGDQTIIGLFGGRFKETVSRASNRRLIELFENAKLNIHPQNSANSVLPQSHASLFVDGPSEPDFENVIDEEFLQSGIQRILKRKHELLDPRILALIKSGIISANQGMSTVSELAAWHQENLGGLISLYNRKVPVLAITGDTDGIDPRFGGQSSRISHQAVQEAGAKLAAFIAPVISEYANLLAAKQKIPFTVEEFSIQVQKTLELLKQINDEEKADFYQALAASLRYFRLSGNDIQQRSVKYYEYCLKQRDSYIKLYMNQEEEHNHTVEIEIDSFTKYLEYANRYESFAKYIADILEIDHEDAFVLN